MGIPVRWSGLTATQTRYPFKCHLITLVGQQPHWWSANVVNNLHWWSANAIGTDRWSAYKYLFFTQNAVFYCFFSLQNSQKHALSLGKTVLKKLTEGYTLSILKNTLQILNEEGVHFWKWNQNSIMPVTSNQVIELWSWLHFSGRLVLLCSVDYSPTHHAIEVPEKLSLFEFY